MAQVEKIAIMAKSQVMVICAIIVDMFENKMLTIVMPAVRALYFYTAPMAVRYGVYQHFPCAID